MRRILLWVCVAKADLADSLARGCGWDARRGTAIRLADGDARQSLAVRASTHVVAGAVGHLVHLNLWYSG